MAKTTSAERMRKMREQARTDYAGGLDPATMADISLSALLDLFAAEVRRCHRDGMRARILYQDLSEEIGRRMEETKSQSKS